MGPDYFFGGSYLKDSRAQAILASENWPELSKHAQVIWDYPPMSRERLLLCNAVSYVIAKKFKRRSG